MLAQRQTGGSERIGELYLLTLPMRPGPDKQATGWLHVLASDDATPTRPLLLSLLAFIAVTCLTAVFWRGWLKRHVDRPLRQTRKALTDLAQGRITGLAPSAHRNPATAVLAALAARLQEIFEVNKQVLFKAGEVRAAHFDPRILQDIDALVEPLIERHRQAPSRLRVQENATGRVRGLSLPRHMFWAGVGALMSLALGAYALFPSSQDSALRSQLQASGNALHQAWRGTLEQDRVQLERVLQDAMNNSDVKAQLARRDPEPMDEALSQTLSTLAPSQSRLVLARLDGSVLASSARPFSDARPNRVILNHLRDGPAEVAGVWQNQRYGYQSGVARSIVTGRGERLVWLATRPLKNSLDELAGRLDAPVALADLRGQAVFEDGEALVQAWRANGRQGFSGKLGAQDVLLSSTLMKSPNGHPLGTLVMTTSQSGTLSNAQLGLGLMATALVIAASLVLLLYVPGLLAPVMQSAEKLAALADPGRASDAAPGVYNDLGLQRSVDLIEEQIDAFNTLRRSRDRQGQRQARFIRQQMLQLASRLDDEARTGILADLERIELAGTTGAPSLESTGLQPDQERDLRLEKIVDEVGILALGFQNLVSRVGDQYQQLDRLVNELRDALRVKTQFIAIQQELEVARKMQLSILPRAFQSRDGLALEATMLPAKEIGGDFYDFFALDAHHVAMAVADVSGKGVPAALFMAVSRTLLRAVAQFSESPAKCLARLNDLLASDNDQMMFVTLFYAVLDTRDGSLVYANAGHNPPYLLRSDGVVEVVPSTGDMALAVMEGLEYSEKTLVLAPGDGLFLFTDGVTEAFDPARVMFGERRLEALLTDLQGLPTTELPNRIIAEVKTFEAGGPQTDDITCLLARYRGLA
jgi:serine phosphatase RsbU (regulator of sigma subunit)